MPLRSPKMYSFIFGFQRFVWCPKCTPASNKSFIAIAAKRPPCRLLAFAELETLARSRHAVFLALCGAGVAGQQPLVFEALAQLRVVADERAGDAQTHGARLARDAAAGNGGQNVELVGRFREHERLADLCPQRL